MDAKAKEQRLREIRLRAAEIRQYVKAGERKLRFLRHREVNLLMDIHNTPVERDVRAEDA